MIFVNSMNALFLKVVPKTHRSEGRLGISQFEFRDEATTAGAKEETPAAATAGLTRPSCLNLTRLATMRTRPP
jgi:hypothetical protein